ACRPRQTDNKTCSHGVSGAHHHRGDGSGGALGRHRHWRRGGHAQINLATNQVRRKLGYAVVLLLSKPVLDRNILSFNPPKLAQLLPERLHEDRAAGSSAIIEETYAEGFSRLLRHAHSPTEGECENDSENPQPF